MPRTMDLRVELEGALEALAKATTYCQGCRGLRQEDEGNLLGGNDERQDSQVLTVQALEERENWNLKERLSTQEDLQATLTKENEQLRQRAQDDSQAVRALREENRLLLDRLGALDSQRETSLDQLERLTGENASLRQSLECKGLKVRALESQLEEGRESLEELREISARLQGEVLAADKEKIR